MTPREKAKQLVGLFIDYVKDVENYREIQKNCAKICINEILTDTKNPLNFDAESELVKYWEDVLFEVEML